MLLTATDQAKLSDFGLSMIVEQSEHSGAIRGTPNYMSPEQAQGKRIDHRSDLYALGIMLYECATGSTPFVGQSLAVIAQHVNAAPEPPRLKCPAISENLESLILALLAKKPEARPSSGIAVALALRDEIERTRGGMPVTYSSPPVRPLSRSHQCDDRRARRAGSPPFHPSNRRGEGRTRGRYPHAVVRAGFHLTETGCSSRQVAAGLDPPRALDPRGERALPRRSLSRIPTRRIETP